jgi:hypothetical protein
VLPFPLYFFHPAVSFVWRFRFMLRDDLLSTDELTEKAGAARISGDVSEPFYFSLDISVASDSLPVRTGLQVSDGRTQRLFCADDCWCDAWSLTFDLIFLWKFKLGRRFLVCCRGNAASERDVSGHRSDE